MTRKQYETLVDAWSILNSNGLLLKDGGDELREITDALHTFLEQQAGRYNCWNYSHGTECKCAECVEMPNV